MRWLMASGLLGLLACERPAEFEPPAPRPAVEVPALADTRKRECIDRLLAAAEPRFHGLLRSLCAEWVNQAIPGMAVAVIERGELRLHAELGVRCLGRPDPIGPRTAFRVGSISKTFTAALVLESLEPAALAEPVVLADLTWPAGMTPPVLAALLGHRSGIGEIDPERLVAFAGAWKPALAGSRSAGPAGEWHYSNAGYVVVGALLEAETGRTYQELLRARFTAFPTITSDPASAARLEAACGHLHEPGGVRAIEVTADLDFMPGDPSWLRPAGGVLSSAEDLARFGATLDPRMLVASEPLPAAAWRHGGSDERYGLGLRSWVLATGTRVFGHSGDNGNFSAELVVAPDRELAVVLLANASTAWSGARLAIDELLARPWPNDQ